MGETYLSFNWLLKEEMQKMEQKDHDIMKSKSGTSLRNPKKQYNNADDMPELQLMQYHQEFEKPIEDRLWLFGKKVGRIRGIFLIKNPPLLK